jgi:hypothetical protein
MEVSRQLHCLDTLPLGKQCSVTILHFPRAGLDVNGEGKNSLPCLQTEPRLLGHPALSLVIIMGYVSEIPPLYTAAHLCEKHMSVIQFTNARANFLFLLMAKHYSFNASVKLKFTIT